MKKKIFRCTELKEEHHDLITKISSLPHISTSEDFTGRVMSKITAERATVLGRIGTFFMHPRHAHIDVRGILSSPQTKAECSFCYILTAAFYLVMGLVLMIGLKAASSDLTLNQWIRTQPQFIMATSFWLFGLGLVLLLDGRLAILGAKGGTLLYIVATLGYSLLFPASNSLPAKYMSVVLSTTATLMGLLLYHHLSAFAKTRSGTTRSQHSLKNP
jgi:hypothetical protein